MLSNITEIEAENKMKPSDPIRCEIFYEGKSYGLATWCPHCGKGFADDDRKTRCPHCGSKIEEEYR